MKSPLREQRAGIRLGRRSTAQRMEADLARANSNTRQRTQGQFSGIPRAVLRHPDFIQLSDKAKALLFDLMAQFRFEKDHGMKKGGLKNNGDLQATWTLMHRDRGWVSKQTLCKATKELLDAGIIIQTRQGGLHQCHLYAVTWEPINRCVYPNGRYKLDVDYTYAPPVNWYKKPAKSQAA